MHATVYHGPRDVRVEGVGDPRIDHPADAVVRIERAIEVTRVGGRISVVGVIVAGDVSLPFMRGVLGKNLSLRSGAVNPPPYCPELVPLIEQGGLDPSEIITQRMPLLEGVRGYESFDAYAEDVLKVVLEA